MLLNNYNLKSMPQNKKTPYLLVLLCNLQESKLLEIAHVREAWRFLFLAGNVIQNIGT